MGAGGMEGPISHVPGARMPKITGFALGSQVRETREPTMAALSLISYAAMIAVQSEYIGGGSGFVIVESTA